MQDFRGPFVFLASETCFRIHVPASCVWFMLDVGVGEGVGAEEDHTFSVMKRHRKANAKPGW